LVKGLCGTFIAIQPTLDQGMGVNHLQAPQR